ncbi:hypothetical protein J6590_049375 [Homalodisca vitripennis]|nr:hypothetical protein J6590_049375 [Homalodisca vitripennis]
MLSSPSSYCSVWYLTVSQTTPGIWSYFSLKKFDKVSNEKAQNEALYRFDSGGFCSYTSAGSSTSSRQIFVPATVASGLTVTAVVYHSQRRLLQLHIRWSISAGNKTSSRQSFVPATVASGLTVTAVVYNSQRRLLQLHIRWSISLGNLLFNHHCSMLWNVFLLLTGNRTSSRQSFVPATVASGLTVTAVVYNSQRRLLQLHTRWSISLGNLLFNHHCSMLWNVFLLLTGNRTSSRQSFVPATVASGLTVTAVVYNNQRRLLQLHIRWSISPNNLLFNHHCSMLWNFFLLLTGNRISSRQSFVPATVASGLTVTAVVYNSQRRLLQLHIRWSISPDNLLFNHHCSMLWNFFLLLTGNRTSSRQSFVPATVASGLTVTAVVYHSQRRLLQLHIRWSISPVNVRLRRSKKSLAKKIKTNSLRRFDFGHTLTMKSVSR